MSNLLRCVEKQKNFKGISNFFTTPVRRFHLTYLVKLKILNHLITPYINHHSYSAAMCTIYVYSMSIYMYYNIAL